MTQPETSLSEETLDPEDWESARALGHRMVDDMLDYLKTLREQPVWRHAPEHVKASFARPCRSTLNPRRRCTRNSCGTCCPIR